ncbi:hypothetical protein GCM10020367_06120 [Streptomyces sannanensis]|uniref:Uncharacterized protein n=1 Tax=Streptomyces sannanensis TaxID=285536 RepID=A0ABP6S4V4_9ACTN
MWPGLVYSGGRPVQPRGAHVAQPGQQVEAEHVGEGEPDDRGAVRVGVLPVDLQVGAVPQHALDHRRDLQFIRINGAVVGSLAGLLIYTVSRAFGA